MAVKGKGASEFGGLKHTLDNRMYIYIYICYTILFA